MEVLCLFGLFLLCLYEAKRVGSGARVGVGGRQAGDISFYDTFDCSISFGSM